MVVYNLTNLTDANNLFEYLEAVNSLTSGLYAVSILLVLFLLMFMVFKHHETKNVFVGASFMMSIMAVLFYFSGFVSIEVMMTVFVMLVAAVIAKMFST